MAESSDTGATAAPPSSETASPVLNSAPLYQPQPYAQNLSLQCAFGLPAEKRYNLQYIGPNLVLCSSANTFQILDLSQVDESGGRSAIKQSVYFGSSALSNVGSHATAIGTVAVHPNQPIFAVAEKGHNPNILLVEYPSMCVLKVLRKGAERAYVNLSFSHNGEKLASVSGDPDYLLTVWDWQAERIILHAKAFSQEVFRVSFSPVNEGRLITSGMGHIRFWKMADTFTGLKLQGALGKFGNLDLSDIAAFVELPNGKVVSGSESGHLLLWDGNLIQFQIGNANGEPCHKGPIDHVSLEGKVIVTAGHDGYMRWWEADRLEYGELEETQTVFPLTLVMERKIGENVPIKTALRGPDHWLLQQADGTLWKLSLQSMALTRVASTHAGAITGCAVAPHSEDPETIQRNDGIAVSCGMDGSVRLWQIAKREVLMFRHFNRAARCVLWLPTAIDPALRTLLVGFEDGVVRVIKRTDDHLQLLSALKPHGNAVTEMACSPDGSLLATACADGTVFFLSILPGANGPSFAPIGFIRTPYADVAEGKAPAAVHPPNTTTRIVPVPSTIITAPKALAWSKDSARLMLACGSVVVEYSRPSAAQMGLSPQQRETFLIELPSRLVPVTVEEPAALSFGEPEAETEKPSEDAEKAEEKPADGAAKEEKEKDKPKEEAPKEKKKEEERALADEVTALAYSADGKTLLVAYGPPPGWVHAAALANANAGDDSKQSGKTRIHDTALQPLGDAPHKSKYEYVFELPLAVVDDRALTTASLPLANAGSTVVSALVLHPLHPQLCAVDQNQLRGSAAPPTVTLPRKLGPVNRVVSWSSSARTPLTLVATRRGVLHLRTAAVATSGVRALSVPIHDPELGPVTGLCVTRHEGKHFAVSTGADGALFSFEVALDLKINELPRAEAQPLTVLPIEPQLADRPSSAGPHPQILPDDGDDITESKAYSIEEAKLKQELDEQLAAASRKKEGVRSEVEAMRREFVDLIRKNLALDESVRLPREAFELDPALREQLEREASLKVEAVKKELAWETEMHMVALEKLKRRYLDRVLVEHIVLHAFKSSSAVHSFRTTELPEQLQKAIEEVHRVIEDEDQQRQAAQRRAEEAAQAAARERAARAAVLQSEEADWRSQSRKGRAETGGSNHGVTVSDARSDAEFRKKAREERKRQRELLEQTKANQSAEDPQDLAAIAEATANMGDFKLKSAPNYIVPDQQRVNAEKKRREMVLLQESVHFIRMGFNHRFLALRDLKRRIVDNITKDNVRLSEINRLLGEDAPLFQPKHDPTEWPERRDVVTDEDLTQFERDRAAEKAKKEADARKGNSFFNPGGASSEQPAPSASPAPAPAPEPAHPHPKERPGASERRASQRGMVLPTHSLASAGSQSSLHNAPASTLAQSPAPSGPAPGSVALPSVAESKSEAKGHFANTKGLSPLEVAELRRERRLLEFERKTLCSKIEQTVATFDQAVQDLRREKFRLDYDLKSTDLKLLTLYQELNLLRNFEESENLLFAKLTKAQASKAQVVTEMTQCEKELAGKLEEIQAWQEKDKQLLTEFSTTVGGSKSEYYSALLKLFKKKVKASKGGKAGNADGSRSRDRLDDDNQSGDENDDYDSDGSASDDDGDSSDGDDDSCPVGCQTAVYERVLELRRKRAELEDMLAEFNAAVAELNKKYQQLQGREKLIDKDLKATEGEIQLFQSEKQRALNQIEVMVPLKLSQIQFLINGSLPGDLMAGLVFTTSRLDQLRARIRQLQDEQGQLRVGFKELKRSHKLLSKELLQKQGLIDQERKKCEDVQMLKFGQIIDLSILEKVGVDENAEELKSKLKSVEGVSVQQLQEWEEKYAQVREQLAQITDQNTRLLERVAQLTKAQYDIEDQLNTTTQKVTVADTSPADRQAREEKEQLMELVRMQSSEIEALRGDIQMLRRKGGNVYT